MDIKSILLERGRTHGNYSDHAGTSQCIKSVMRNTQNWRELTPSQTETLEMIAHKIGRILCGDANHIDHWLDISGYATLVAEQLKDRK